MANLTKVSGTLQANLNRSFQGYFLSEMGENDDKLKRAEMFDDYLIISAILKEMSDKE
jgi:hypothetical protein